MPNRPSFVEFSFIHWICPFPIILNLSESWMFMEILSVDSWTHVFGGSCVHLLWDHGIWLKTHYNMKTTETECDNLIAKPCKRIFSWEEKERRNSLEGCKTNSINELDTLEMMMCCKNYIRKDNQSNGSSSLWDVCKHLKWNHGMGGTKCHLF